MLLKLLVYAVAIWFFVRILRRFAMVWFGINSARSNAQKHAGGRHASSNRRIDDVEEADYIEIDDKR